ncbi:VacJ family lipoprotein [Halioxenophilus sp. WMMB6]|uniref:MlaA family lipoprotein n=1 Tax=Halioxenophilus sp. WMMB6 TaxID=3073815 RepID=UPI00295F0F4C|nr:VacJ family lipoprotein [Halioxenophilus sp. WMMB6]
MRLILLLTLSILVTACATSPTAVDQSAPENNTEAPVKVVNSDPWEGFNRQVYRFNDALDRAFLKPVAKGYKWITPDPVEKGVSNVFDNLGEIRTVVNSILQWKWASAGNSTGRFVVNSTVGLVGIFDVAKVWGMDKPDGEDFGQTLATWGVGSGPFLVLPLFGPSTLRDGVARPVDWYTDPINYIKDSDAQLGLNAVSVIDTRAQLLEAEELVSGDRYSFIRDAYLQRRNYLIKDGQIEDDFGADDDAYEDFDDIDF